ncbi:toxin-antitoxin system antitoxin subunit [Lapillicoccus sp.]|uniref:FitA-like ribbon-helix-helix domain-containing protein n=1 Tax=Lapillicoccus sp. TaxID=1909287 RepID=UPI0025D07D2B|nr:toxin-antitoxin system antitoxin subunit [Lapillicoccus sp.]
MATLTIRQLDDTIHSRLRLRAAEHGRSVEAEVRAILDAAVNRPDTNVLIALGESMAQVGGIDLERPERVDRPRAVDLP